VRVCLYLLDRYHGEVMTQISLMWNMTTIEAAPRPRCCHVSLTSVDGNGSVGNTCGLHVLRDAGAEVLSGRQVSSCSSAGSSS